MTLTVAPPTTSVDVQADPSGRSRADLVAGLRAIADWFDTHPDAPAPTYMRLANAVSTVDDRAGIAEVVAIAGELGVAFTSDSGVVSATRQFGPVEFTTSYVTCERMAEHERQFRASAGEAWSVQP